MRTAFNVAERVATVALSVTAAMYAARGIHWLFEHARTRFNL